jgi:hypothetical protein
MSRSSLSLATITDEEHVDQIVTVQSARTTGTGAC